MNRIEKMVKSNEREISLLSYKDFLVRKWLNLRIIKIKKIDFNKVILLLLKLI